MPFRKKGAAGLTERLDVRVAPAEKARLRAMAAVTGFPVAELVRTRALGRPVVSRTDVTTVRELKRLGGLLKKVHLDSGGAYRAETAAALADLRAAIARLAAGDGGPP
jgi:prophage DNA circulation protein